jgi:hypothetical protein
LISQRDNGANLREKTIGEERRYRQGDAMLFGGKVEAILKKKTGQDAIIEIDNLLSPVFYKKPQSLSVPERNICYIEDLEREVNNGGLDQFFVNSSGDNTQETISALREIGSVRFLGILESATKQFPEARVPKDRDERMAVMEQIEDKTGPVWDSLDTEFYKYEEDIYGLLTSYINRHIKDFR